MPESPRRTVVVGAGVAGLTAARDLAATGREVIVLEGSSRVGGKLLVGEVAGVGVDLGAEAMLARRPEGIDLARALGLDVVHPATTSSSVWTRGALRPMPRSVMGVPADVEQVAAPGCSATRASTGCATRPAADPWPTARTCRSASWWPPGSATRSSTAWSSRCSAVCTPVTRACCPPARPLPQLVVWSSGSSLVEAATRCADGVVRAGLRRAWRVAWAGSPWHSPTGSTSAPARPCASFAVRRPASRWSSVRPTAAEEVLADEVVLATPAAPTARLLADVAPAAAAELAGVEYASMAIVTLAFRAADVPDLPGSGFLVPPVDGRTIKASTFSFAKWDWVREAGDGLLLLRTSIGRHREEARPPGPRRRPRRRVAGRPRATPSAWPRRLSTRHVQRWGGGLPQYAVGHLDRVARIRADVAGCPGLAVCGAAYDGVGIPARHRLGPPGRRPALTQAE